MQPITLSHLVAAVLGAGAYLYQCAGSGGYWKAAAIVCGQRIERDHRSPYSAIAAVFAVLREYEAAQAAIDAAETPAARAAYRQAWATSVGQPPLARFAAAEAAAATAGIEEDEEEEDIEEDEENEQNGEYELTNYEPAGWEPAGEEHDGSNYPGKYGY